MNEAKGVAVEISGLSKVFGEGRKEGFLIFGDETKSLLKSHLEQPLPRQFYRVDIIWVLDYIWR